MSALVAFDGALQVLPAEEAVVKGTRVIDHWRSVRHSEVGPPISLHLFQHSLPDQHLLTWSAASHELGLGSGHKCSRS